MSADFQYETFEGDEEKARVKWNVMIDLWLKEFGTNIYGGHLGLKGKDFSLSNSKDTAFNTAKDAEEYIMDYNEKWDNATAVWYWEGKELRIMVGGWCAT